MNIFTSVPADLLLDFLFIGTYFCWKLNFVILVDNCENEVAHSVVLLSACGESCDFLNSQCLPQQCNTIQVGHG